MGHSYTLACTQCGYRDHVSDGSGMSVQVLEPRLCSRCMRVVTVMMSAPDPDVLCDIHNALDDAWDGARGIAVEVGGDAVSCDALCQAQKPDLDTLKKGVALGVDCVLGKTALQEMVPVPLKHLPKLTGKTPVGVVGCAVGAAGAEALGVNPLSP